jgi:hypothetical protein
MPSDENDCENLPVFVSFLIGFEDDSGQRQWFDFANMSPVQLHSEERQRSADDLAVAVELVVG